MKEKLGVEIEPVRTLQGNDRYVVSLVTFEGRPAVLKKAVTAELEPRLEQEARLYALLQGVQEANPQVVFRVPKLYASSRDWLLVEYFDAPTLGTKEELTAPHAVAPFVDRMVDLLAGLDMALTGSQLQNQIYLTAHGQPNDRFQKLEKQMGDWQKTAVDAAVSTAEKFEGLSTYARKNLAYVRHALQLGDIKPWELFQLPEGKLGLIDFELGGMFKARYFDLAYLFIRLWGELHSPAEAAWLLKAFIERGNLDKNAFTQAFLPIFSIKLIGCSFDCARHLPDNNYLSEMRDLLERALTFNIDNLTEI